MNKRNSIICLLLLLAAPVKTSIAQSGNAGSSGLSFLKVGVGARAAGLGEAYAAVSDDATATFWNPAGLSFADRAQLAFTHTEWIADITNEFLAFSFPAFHGVLGLSLYANNVGGIERRSNPSIEPIGTIDANDIALGLSYAQKFGSLLSAGITVKYLYEKIFVESTAGYAFDVGLIFQPLQRPLKLALVLQNFGSMDELQDQAIELPETVRVGVSYLLDLPVIEGAVLLAADGVKVSGNDLRGNFGAELLFKSRLAFRLGYQTSLDQKSFAGGLGLQFKQYHIDYGFTPFDSVFGDTHRFSAMIEF